MIYRPDYQLTAKEVYPRQELSGFQLSPDGLWISFLIQRDKHSSEVEEKGSLYVKDKPMADLCLLPSSGGFPRLLTNTGDIHKAGSWSADGKTLVFVRAEKLQLLELAEKTDGEISITGLKTIYKHKLYDPRPAEMGDAYLSYPCWRPPEEDFLLFATYEDKQTALRVISPDGREQRELYSVCGTILGWQWSPDGNTILFITSDENSLEGHVFLLDFESGSIKKWEEKYYKGLMKLSTL